MKLTSRFGSSSLERLQGIIANYQNNLDVELQQRACEYSKIFKWDNIRKSLLQRIPVVEDRVKQPESPATPVLSTSTTSVSTSKSLLDDLGIDIGVPVQTTKPQTTSSSSNINLLSEIFGEPLVPTTPSIPTNTVPWDLKSVMPDPAPLVNVAPAPSLMTQPSPASTLIAYQKNGLTISFDITKQPGSPNNVSVTANISNAQAVPLNNFEFKAAVPKYIKLQVNPPSGNVVPPLNSGKVTQSLKLVNTLHGEKPVLLKIKVDYVLNGAPVSDIGDVSLP
jgi:AP-1 complex subunit gamma-1